TLIAPGSRVLLTARVRDCETGHVPSPPVDAAAESWRHEVVAFLDAHASRRGGLDDWSTSPVQEDPGAEAEYFARCRAWQATVYDGHFAGITWPSEYGGRGGAAWQQAIYREEEARYDVR